ncbi:MAG: type II toxin-antitoxin system VapC family toxin [Candidatus Lokiarchaeota archaeon]|nr:type II toxin-antitoxin system VapC family toxin [Candidatus Lokiarchaeota archaeon]
MEKVYIDTNIFLNPILYDINKNQEAKKSKNFLEEIITNKKIGFTSVLTWDEFVWILRKTLGINIAIEKGKKFLVFPNLKIVKLSLTTINRAQDLIANYHIQTRDAIHAASALENKINKIISFDGDFDIINEIERNEP